MIKDRVKYTPLGFSYVEVTIDEIKNWGGLGICNSCGQFHDKMNLCFVLTDTYCDKCFNEIQERMNDYSKEDIEFDLGVQKDRDIPWYERLLK